MTKLFPRVLANNYFFFHFRFSCTGEFRQGPRLCPLRPQRRLQPWRPIPQGSEPPGGRPGPHVHVPVGPIVAAALSPEDRDPQDENSN